MIITEFVIIEDDDTIWTQKMSSPKPMAGKNENNETYKQNLQTKMNKKYCVELDLV